MHISIPILLVAALLSPNPSFADGSSVKGTVIGKNDSGKGLSGVLVQSDSSFGGAPCLLGKIKTDDQGNFYARTNPACTSLTLRFTRGGFADALADVDNSKNINDIGVVELEGLGRPTRVRGGGAPVRSGRSRMTKIAIAVVVAVTGIGVGFALTH